MGVGLVGGDHLEQPLAEEVQLSGVVVAWPRSSEVRLGRRDEVGVEDVGQSSSA